MWIKSCLHRMSVAALLCCAGPSFAGQLVRHHEITFERNQGQTERGIEFLARAPGFRLSVGSCGAGIAIAGEDGTKHSIRMSLIGSDQHAFIEGLDQRPGIVNYLLGSNPAAWRTGLATFGRLRARSVYRGIDLVYYANQSDLEYDFVLAPGADPKAIRMRFDGTSAMHVNPDGDLVLAAGGREFTERHPTVYQEKGGERRRVDARYAIAADRTVSFVLAPYDSRLEVVIDPILGYATLLGGKQDDHVLAIAVDRSGAAYVAGYTQSTDFPVQAPLQGQPGAGSTQSAFVSKISPDGKTLVYSTYLGGSAVQSVNAIAVDAAGNVYIAGFTSSKDFPLQGAIQPAHGGGTSDAFAAKLDATGSKLLYSTYLGGNGRESVAGLAIDAAGSAYITGATMSSNFPLKNAYQSTLGASSQGDGDAFLAKIDPAGATMVYSTYLGGTSDDLAVGVAVDSTGAAVVVGITNVKGFPLTSNAFPSTADTETAFITRFAPDGRSLLFSSLLGNAHASAFEADDAHGMAMDPTGAVTIVGVTFSQNFPTTPGTLQSSWGKSRYGFFRETRPWAMKVDPAAGARLYSTFLGIDGTGVGVATDSSANSYVILNVNAVTPELPTKDAVLLSNGITGALLVLNPQGTDLVYGTFTNVGVVYPRAVAVDSRGSAYVAGWTDTSHPSLITTGAVQTRLGGGDDANVIKFFQDTTTGVPRIDAVTNAGGYEPAPVSPGEIVTIFGSGLAPDPLTGLQLDASGKVATSLAGVHVLFDGVPAPLIYVSGGQVSAVVPQALDTTKSFTAVQIDNGGSKSLPVYVAIGKTNPGVFTADGSGSGQAAALNQDFSINSASNPAAKARLSRYMGRAQAL